MINNKIEKYINEIENVWHQANIIVASLQEKISAELKEYIFDSASIRMCIKYESFTSEAYRKMFNNLKISYNRPWSYTRKIAKELNIKIDKEYKVAHDGWEIYNSLKHVNLNTLRWSEKLEKKLNLNTPKERCLFIKKGLIQLLFKLKT